MAIDPHHHIDEQTRSDEHEPAEPEPAWYAVYAGSGEEADAYLALEDLDAVEPFLPAWRVDNVRHAYKANPVRLREAIFFRNYVLLRAGLTESLLDEIEQLGPVKYVVGTKASGPSPIPDAQIALIRSLLGMERRPELGDMPEKGRRATVISGPMKGLEGLVTWRNKTHARLATEIALMGRTVEITAPLDVLMLSEYVTAAGRFRPRRRGGKRARRSANVKRDVA